MSRHFAQLNLNKNFLIAAEQNQADSVRTLLQKGADSNSKGLFGRSAMHIATRNNNKELVRILLSNKVKIDSMDDFGRSPLFCACEFGTLDIVRILLDKGSDTNIKANNETSPLHHATSRDNGEWVIAKLLAHGADINTTDSYNKSPLHWACVFGNYNVVRLLLEKGANHVALDEEYSSPRDIAVRHGHTEIADLIKRFTSRRLKAVTDVSTQTEVSSVYSIASAVDSDDIKDLKFKLVSLTGDIEELEQRLKLSELEKLKMVKNRDILKPRLDVADNFLNLSSNDEAESVRWTESKDRLTSECNDLIAQEATLIEKIRTLALQIKVLKIERVQVFLKIDDIVTLQLQVQDFT